MSLEKLMPKWIFLKVRMEKGDFALSVTVKTNIVFVLYRN